MTEVESKEGGANVRFPPPAVYLGFILVGIALRYAVELPVPVPRIVAILAGLVFLAAGFWLISDAWKLFQRTAQDPKPWKPSPQLLLSGAYRFTRNPMYVGMTSLQVGLGLAFNNLWISLLAAGSLLVVHFIAVMPEERYLTQKFGDSYKVYLIKVRRYL